MNKRIFKVINIVIITTILVGLSCNKSKKQTILSNQNKDSITKENIKNPINEYSIRLHKKLIEYQKIEKMGGFPKIITTKNSLALNDKDSCLLTVKQHLFLTKDLKINDKNIIFTDSLQKAIQYFQHRLGLMENGKIDNTTLKELNHPISYRIKQIKINLERLKLIPDSIEKDYILVNIPAFKLYIFENKKPIWHTNVIVGKTANQTQIFKGNISQILLNPYWNIPSSIVQKEIAPKMRRNRKYLVRNNMEIISKKPLSIRQKPGKNNAVGKIKFLFPNDYNIYLHDTPAKNLFEINNRAFSHGCIRVENPKKLAIYLLRKNTFWNIKKIDSTLLTNKETVIKLKPMIPVYIVYFTAWVDKSEQIYFRNDVYNLDDKIAKKITE